MQISVREAVEQDCEAIFELIKELALFEKSPEQVTVSFDHFKNAGFSNNPVWWAYVAEVNGVCIGVALYYVRYSTWKGKRLYLEDIIVNENYRGKGVGTKLFNQIIDCAKQKNYSGIMFQALDWNVKALDFYKKFGVEFDNEWINCNLDTEKG